jgi:hypothetical protein
MPSRKSAQTAAAVAAPAPELVKPEMVEPALDISELQDLADEAEQFDDEEAKPEAVPEPQKIIKLTQFIKDLKADYPEAKRFNIYFFTDRIQKFENPWTDNAANIYLKPAAIIITQQKGSAIVLSCETFNKKLGTVNWGINFSESNSRKIDTTSVINILKALPEEQEYNGCKYYRTTIMKPEPTEKKLADSITKQIHDQFPVFKRTFEPKQESTRKATDEDVLAAVQLCI